MNVLWVFVQWYVIIKSDPCGWHAVSVAMHEGRLRLSTWWDEIVKVTSMSNRIDHSGCQ